MNDTCKYRFFNLFSMEYYIAFSIIVLIEILTWRYGEIVTKYKILMLNLILNVWLIARLCNSLNLWYQVDVFTVYFFVWQFIYLFSKWISQELPWISFTIQQGLLCLWMAFLAFIIHDTASRYFPFYFKFAFLWYYSVEDW